MRMVRRARRAKQGRAGSLRNNGGSPLLCASGSPERHSSASIFSDRSNATCKRREIAVRETLILAAILGAATWPAIVGSQEASRAKAADPVEREKLLLTGWDPDEPAP